LKYRTSEYEAEELSTAPHFMSLLHTMYQIQLDGSVWLYLLHSQIIVETKISVSSVDTTAEVKVSAFAGIELRPSIR
jgi:membrane protein implicated in regulation of membrane protease activity